MRRFGLLAVVCLMLVGCAHKTGDGYALDRSADRTTAPAGRATLDIKAEISVDNQTREFKAKIINVDVEPSPR